MNKSQVGRSLSGAFSKHALWEGIAITALFSIFVSGVVVLCALLSQVGVGPPGQSAASYELVAASILCLITMTAVQRLASSHSSHAEMEIKERWLTLYKGTEWTTPAGERGVASDVNIDANRLEILFADGKKHYLPLRYLNPVNAEGPEADFADLKTDGSVDWRFYGSGPRGPVGTVIFLGLLGVLGWSVFHTDVPSWSILPILLVLFFSGFIALGLLASKAPFYSVGDFAYPLLVAKTTWKALDGRVGVVRWAQRKYEGENVYSETILLAFPEGDEAWFRRGDLKASAFEC